MAFARKEETIAKRYLNSEEASVYLGMSPRSLVVLRCNGKGPIYSKIGKRVMYDINDLNDYAEKRKVDPSAKLRKVGDKARAKIRKRKTTPESSI